MPRRALTAATVERIKPPKVGQIEHFDKGFPGLALRVSYGGGKSFVFFYRRGGRLRRLTLGTYPALSLADARQAWREARQEVARGRDPALVHEKPSTLCSLVVEDWLKRDQAKNKSVGQVRRIINKDVLPAWGSRQVADLGRRDVLDLIDGIADRGAVIMARRVHAYVHRFFRWCVGRGIIETNPATDIPKPGAASRRDRVLTDEELATVWHAAERMGGPHGGVIQLLMLTGARLQEMAQLRWSEMSGDLIHLEGARTKNGQPHTIPLSNAARAVLERVPRIHDSDFVFTLSGRRAIQGWGVAKRRLDEIACVAPWVTHDLRRTVATGLQKLGVGLQVIEAVLGHVSGSRAGVVGIYQRHSFDAEKRAALEAWGAQVMALVEGREPGKVLPMRGKA